MILIRGLCKDFAETRAVRDLSFEVKRGELFGLVGPDGAGKTTTLRMLAGILEPTSGEIWVDGISVVDDPEGIKGHIAYMPQRFGLYQDLTLMENLIFYADLFMVPKKDRGPRIERLLGFSRLAPFKERLAGALSGGMKQKLGLACALIHSPKLLLLDEPTNGVDPVSRRDFWTILYDLLKEGISILVSTAYLDEAERTTRVGLMHEGSLIRVGRPQAIMGMVEGIVLELVPSDVRAARRRLRTLPEILSANVFGGSLHIRVGREENVDAVRTALVSAGIAIHSLRPIRASMEDAFLCLLPQGSMEIARQPGSSVADE
ncbi:MAG: ABC transporter ATP-binding protein [Desulfomonile tiedjei]|nr:ABC transporter ATP-binding protein [Desulfomonile tiedjei]